MLQSGVGGGVCVCELHQGSVDYNGCAPARYAVLSVKKRSHCLTAWSVKKASVLLLHEVWKHHPCCVFKHGA